MRGVSVFEFDRPLFDFLLERESSVFLRFLLGGFSVVELLPFPAVEPFATVTGTISPNEKKNTPSETKRKEFSRSSQ